MPKSVNWEFTTSLNNYSTTIPPTKPAIQKLSTVLKNFCKKKKKRKKVKSVQKTKMIKRVRGPKNLLKKKERKIKKQRKMKQP
jgi:hypothetical protein